jgi:hypothetical protein
VAQAASVVPAVARSVAARSAVVAWSAVVALAVAWSAVAALAVAWSAVAALAVARVLGLAVVLRAGTPALEERLRREGHLQLVAQ